VSGDHIDFVLERDGARVVHRSFSMLVIVRAVVPPAVKINWPAAAPKSSGRQGPT
jgi:hypothetical protein